MNSKPAPITVIRRAKREPMGAIVTQVLAGEKALVVEAARSRDMTVAEFVRRAIVNELERGDAGDV